MSTVNSRFKKDPNLQIHLHKAFFWTSGFQILYTYKSFLNQTILDLRKEKRSLLNRDLPVSRSHFGSKLFGLSQIYFGSMYRGMAEFPNEILDFGSVLPTLYVLLMCRDVGTGGQAAGAIVPPPPILADMLTRSGGGGGQKIMPPQLLLAPPDFKTFLRP